MLAYLGALSSTVAHPGVAYIAYTYIHHYMDVVLYSYTYVPSPPSYLWYPGLLGPTDGLKGST